MKDNPQKVTNLDTRITNGDRNQDQNPENQVQNDNTKSGNKGKQVSSKKQTSRKENDEIGGARSQRGEYSKRDRMQGDRSEPIL
ncbi:MAG TPA: hypothetical protein VNS32_29425 [Flavisolibacter sp.]|nr:hypothetical protein [Flavisolibacter sp.]